MSYLKINRSKERDRIVENYLFQKSQEPVFKSQKLQEPKPIYKVNNPAHALSPARTPAQGLIQIPTQASTRQKEKRGTLFGVESKGDGLYIGKSPITIGKDNTIITINGINYNLILGLLELRLLILIQTQTSLVHRKVQNTGKS